MLVGDGKSRNISYAVNGCGKLIDRGWKEQKNGSCDLSAAGNRGRLGGYHPPTHAPPSPARLRQPGMDLAGSDGSPIGEPDLVVAWPRGVLAHSAGRCLALCGDNVDGVSDGVWFINGMTVTHHQKRVVVVGAGFGGLNAVKRLSGHGLDVLLVDRNNYHLFVPSNKRSAPRSLKW